MKADTAVLLNDYCALARFRQRHALNQHHFLLQFQNSQLSQPRNSHPPGMGASSSCGSASAGDEGWTMTTSATVLVVDDDPILLTVVTHKLTSCGYRVITAADGAIGLSQARAKKPDIIVLDMMMPTLDGRQVLNALQADSALASVPVIVLTSRRGEHDVIEALQHGDYLAKPFSPDELVARIARLITKPQPARS